MQLTIHPSVFSKIQNFKLGMIYYNKTTVSASPKMLKGRLQLFQEQLYFELLDKPVPALKGIAEWQTVWQTGRATVLEERLQQIKAHDYISSFHSAEDLNTFFSLQYEMPAVIYDAEKIAGDIELSIGGDEDGYEGLNGKFNNFSSMPLLTDSYSPFGSPYTDSIRTAVTEESENLLQLLFIPPSLSKENAQQLTEACAQMFTSISGGSYAAAVLNYDHPSCTIAENPAD